MGDISYVYGCIVGPTHYQQGTVMRQRNAERIAALPQNDTWPFLTRDLFSEPNPEHLYEAQIIHFGASYNQIERAWHLWLDKFERLLRTMFWDVVQTHLCTPYNGDYHFMWIPVATQQNTLYSNPPQPLDQWVFSGGPRSFTVP